MHSNALQCLTHLRWREAEVTTISCTKAFTSPIMAMSYFYLKYHKHFLYSGIYVTIFYCDLLFLNSTHHILNFKRQNLSLAAWHKVVFFNQRWEKMKVVKCWETIFTRNSICQEINFFPLCGNCGNCSFFTFSFSCHKGKEEMANWWTITCCSREERSSPGTQLALPKKNIFLH